MSYNPLARVLVVDDDDVVRASLVDELSSAHYQVDEVGDAEAALKVLDHSQYDAVISDVRMPGMDGAELMRRLNHSHTNLVKILLTGFDDESAQQIAHGNNGIYKFMKPWGDELEITLRRAIEHRQQFTGTLATLEQERVARNQAEEALQRLDKMASLGTLAGGIAHEMRSPLSYLTSNMDFLREEVPNLVSYFKLTQSLLEKVEGGGRVLPDELKSQDPENILGETGDIVEECTIGIQRLTDILRAISAYCKPRTAAHARMDLVECIEQAIKLLMCVHKHRVTISRGFERSPCPVVGNSGELGQVFVNLITNGIQAMDGEGEVEVTTHHQDGLVHVTISDQGPGIPNELHERIFDTFFSTKLDTVGTGLGLSICKSIANQHEGNLVYKPSSEPGASFVLTLPLAPVER